MSSMGSSKAGVSGVMTMGCCKVSKARADCLMALERTFWNDWNGRHAVMSGVLSGVRSGVFGSSDEKEH